MGLVEHRWKSGGAKKYYLSIQGVQAILEHWVFQNMSGYKNKFEYYKMFNIPEYDLLSLQTMCPKINSKHTMCSKI